MRMRRPILAHWHTIAAKLLIFRYLSFVLIECEHTQFWDSMFVNDNPVGWFLRFRFSKWIMEQDKTGTNHETFEGLEMEKTGNGIKEFVKRCYVMKFAEGQQVNYREVNEDGNLVALVEATIVEVHDNLLGAFTIQFDINGRTECVLIHQLQPVDEVVDSILFSQVK